MTGLDSALAHDEPLRDQLDSVAAAYAAWCRLDKRDESVVAPSPWLRKERS